MIEGERILKPGSLDTDTYEKSKEIICELGFGDIFSESDLNTLDTYIKNLIEKYDGEPALYFSQLFGLSLRPSSAEHLSFPEAEHVSAIDFYDVYKSKDTKDEMRLNAYRAVAAVEVLSRLGIIKRPDMIIADTNSQMKVWAINRLGFQDRIDYESKYLENNPDAVEETLHNPFNRPRSALVLKKIVLEPGNKQLLHELLRKLEENFDADLVIQAYSNGVIAKFSDVIERARLTVAETNRISQMRAARLARRLISE